MGARFARRRGRVVLHVGEGEHLLLAHLLTQLLEVVGEAPQGPVDPLAAALGIGTATTLPEDPVLARLFPDGYTDDDEASADFRRYTEPGLRDRKRTAAETALRTLGDEPGSRALAPEEAQAWLVALNDLRLAIGTRLGLDDDVDLDELADEDPRAPLAAVYDLLTHLQEMLVRSLD